MELLKLYRRKVFTPWIALGIIVLLCAAALLYILRNDDRSVIGLIFLLYLVGLGVSTFRAFTGLGTRGFRRYTAGLTPEEREELYRQYRDGYHFCDAVMTEECVVILNSKYLDVLPYGDIVWIYEAERTTRLTGTTWTLALITADKRSHAVTVNKKGRDSLQEFVEGIRRHRPGVLLGYDKEIMRLFRKDFAKLVAMSGEVLPSIETPPPQGAAAQEIPGDAPPPGADLR